MTVKLSITVGQGGHDQLVGTLRSWLFTHAMMYRRTQRGTLTRENGDRYASTEELVLFAGKPTYANFDEMGVFDDMAPGQCFSNAHQCAGPDWLYTEGWAVMDHGIPTHHAWLTHRETGKVEDPTWRGLYNRGRAQHGHHEKFTGNAVFWGVSIDRFDHAVWCMRYNYPNLLSIGEYDIPETRRWGVDAFTMDLPAPEACSLCDKALSAHDEDCPKRIFDSIVVGMNEEFGKGYAHG